MTLSKILIIIFKILLILRILESLHLINHRLDEQAIAMTAVRQAVDKLSATTTAAALAAAKRTGAATGPAARAVQLADQFRSVLCVLIGILMQSLVTWMFGNRWWH